MRKFIFAFLTVLLAIQTIFAQRIRVACIGNSITYGHGIQDRKNDTYPAQLQRLLGEDYEVVNFGVSGTTAQREGDFPWTTTKEYTAAKEFQPQIAVIKLGTNDSKPQNWVGAERFISNLETLAEEFEQLNSHPTIIIALPAKAYEVRWNIHDDIIAQQEIPAIRKMAKKHHWQLIDLYKATSNMQENFPDGIHPNVAGAGIIAKEVMNAVKNIKIKVKKNAYKLDWKEGNAKNGATIERQGKTSILNLGDKDGYYDMAAETSQLIQNLSSFTISVCFKVSSANKLDGYGHFLFAFSQLAENKADEGPYVAMRLNEQRFETSTGGYQHEEIVMQGGKPQRDVWVHALFRQEGKKGQLFLDGQLIGTNEKMPLPSDIFRQAPACCWIGRAPFRGDKYLSGTQVADFTIYNYAVSDKELSKLLQQKNKLR